MRISDWSSDVCSSDLARNRRRETTDCGNTLARHADRGEIAAGDGRWRLFAAACDLTLQQGTRCDNGDLLAEQRADGEVEGGPEAERPKARTAGDARSQHRTARERRCDRVTARDRMSKRVKSSH